MHTGAKKIIISSPNSVLYLGFSELPTPNSVLYLGFSELPTPNSILKKATPWTLHN
jgi:hypothetical protein